MTGLKKPYQSHELAFRKLRAKGMRSWDEYARARRADIDCDVIRLNRHTPDDPTSSLCVAAVKPPRRA